jgi:tRNA-2-methylthio-N6-dimethylallyladenosine synthase
MNELDSELMLGLLLAQGFSEAKSEEDADVVLLNTCCVREMAERKALGKMGLLGQMKEKKPGLLLGICGCIAQKSKQKLLDAMPFLDIVCGTRQLGQLAEMIETARRNGTTQLRVEDDFVGKLDFRTARRKSPVKAFVSIMRGCDNYCSYCVVPYVRGRERSRSPEEIVAEVEDLARRGYKEVTLLGQNVNSYGKGLGVECDLVGLLERINRVEGIERIRFVTSHAKDISPRLIEAMARLEKVCEHLHFPLQSGSDKILKLMNRGYTLDEYLRTVDALRRVVPDIALGTDIIVGFPGETEGDFAQTVEAMRAIEYDSAFIFKYSTREGTEAARLPDDVPLATKKERNRIVLQLQEGISLMRNRSLIGEQAEVLVEGPSKRNPRKMMGRTRQNKIAVFDGARDLIGRILNLTVTDATAVTLFCEIRQAGQSSDTLRRREEHCSDGASQRESIGLFHGRNEDEDFGLSEAEGTG